MLHLNYSSQFSSYRSNMYFAKSLLYSTRSMGLRSSTREVIDDIIPISRKYLRKLHRFKWLSSSFSQKDLKGYI